MLGDIINAVKETVIPYPDQLLMKMDIELFECRAILGSPEVLTGPKNIPFVAVVMEWLFLRNNGEYTDQCPKEKVVELAKFFLDNGFTPFLVDVYNGHLSKLSVSQYGAEWKCNVAWLHNSITENDTLV